MATKSKMKAFKSGDESKAYLLKANENNEDISQNEFMDAINDLKLTDEEIKKIGNYVVNNHFENLSREKLAKELEAYRPMFIEEPVLPENLSELKTLINHTTIPIATGERLYSRWDYKPLFEKEGITADVINLATIKPFDKKTVLESIEKTGCVVTAEEHFIYGGMGEMIAGYLAQNRPAPIEYVAIADKFGQSGTPAELMKAYGLDAAHIVAAARKAIARK